MHEPRLIRRELRDRMMQSFDVLPAQPLTGDGPVTALFRSRGLRDFQGAARDVAALPYGRVSDWRDPTLVLREGRGTCSTKHALLAVLAREQGTDVGLTLGIYEMNERNTPGVDRVLARHGLDAILEAHCYLTHGGMRIDVTRDVRPEEPIVGFLHEEPITPDQIGDYKIAVHKRFLGTWAASSPASGGRQLDELWRIREECIAALGDGGGR